MDEPEQEDQTVDSVAGASQEEDVRFVLPEHAAKVTGQDLNTALIEGIKLGKTSFVKWLLDVGANPNAEDRRQAVPGLVHAIVKDHPRIVKHLIRAGVDVNAPDQDGWRPLNHAAECGHLKMVKYLINTGKHNAEG